MEVVDEWLLQSLRLYRDLHTFELQAPTRIIEWVRGNRVCVAGYRQSDGNEILQLIPPPTLLTKETQGLRPERDFKVECGGFSERPVYSLKYVPDTSLLVTSGPPDSSLQVWQVSAEDSDVIKSVSTIARENGTEQSWAKTATISARAPWVLHGSRLDRVQITEVESGKNVYTAASRGSEELSDLAFLDCNTLLLCCTTGRLCLADIRQSQSLVEAMSVPSVPCSEQWCMGTKHGAQGLEPSSQPVARLSSRGLLTLTDLRKISEHLAFAKARVSSPDSGAEFLCVSWAPALEGYLAISGFDGTVHVYDTQSWDSSGREAEPIFVHKGHAFGGAGDSGDPPLVTVHTWHLQKPRTLLSAASDGSLHVWDWVQPCGKCGLVCRKGEEQKKERGLRRAQSDRTRNGFTLPERKPAKGPGMTFLAEAYPKLCPSPFRY